MKYFIIILIIGYVTFPIFGKTDDVIYNATTVDDSLKNGTNLEESPNNMTISEISPWNPFNVSENGTEIKLEHGIKSKIKGGYNKVKNKVKEIVTKVKNKIKEIGNEFGKGGNGGNSRWRPHYRYRKTTGTGNYSSSYSMSTVMWIIVGIIGASILIVAVYYMCRASSA